MLRSTPQEAKQSPEQLPVIKKIQRWFLNRPFRKEATLIINNHEKELKLSAVDLTERTEFLSEIKTQDYLKIAERKNIPQLALSALKANKLSPSTTATLLELSQHIHVYGKENVLCIAALDEKREITRSAIDVFTLLYARCFEIKALPSQFLSETGYHQLLKRYTNELKKNPGLHLLYYIKDTTPSTGFNDILYYTTLPLPSNEKKSARLITLSFSTADALGQAIFSQQWIKKEYRLGTLTKDDIEKASHRNVRLASLSTPDIKLPTEVHRVPVSAAAYSQHDEFHRQQYVLFPKNIRKILQRIIFITRQITGFAWSHELWTLVDADFSEVTDILNAEIVSAEHFFFRMMNRIYSFNVEDQAQIPQTIAAEIAGRKTLQAEGKFVFNKNASNLLLWILVMDMVDHPLLWKSVLNIDIDSKEHHFDHHIALYRSLKTNILFLAFDKKEKIYVLDDVYRKYEARRSPYNIARYPHYLPEFCPPSNILFFKKRSKSEADQEILANMLSLEFKF